MSSGPLFAAGTFVWGLAAMSQLHRRPFASNLVLQQFPPPYSTASLEDAARSLNFKAGLRKVASAQFRTLPQPFLAILAPQPLAANDAPSASALNRLAVILRCDRDNVLYLTESSAAPTTAQLTDFNAEYAGLIMLCSPQAPPVAEEPAEACRRASSAFAGSFRSCSSTSRSGAMCWWHPSRFKSSHSRRRCALR